MNIWKGFRTNYENCTATVATIHLPVRNATTIYTTGYSAAPTRRSRNRPLTSLSLVK